MESTCGGAGGSIRTGGVASSPSTGSPPPYRGTAKVRPSRSNSSVAGGSSGLRHLKVIFRGGWAPALMESSAALVEAVIHPRLRARWVLRMVNMDAASRRRGSSDISASKMFRSARSKRRSSISAAASASLGLAHIRRRRSAEAMPNSAAASETLTA
jgi:hypothetical protein